MEIVKGEYPPNYKAIAKAFKIKDKKGVVFTYGDELFVPSGGTPDKYLLRHEETHQRQQNAMGVEVWWELYLKDPEFRYNQELEAYRNQYKSMGDLPIEARMSYLEHISTDLAGPIYGNLMTVAEARAVITDGIVPKRPGSFKSNNLRKAKKRQRQNRKKGRR